MAKLHDLYKQEVIKALTQKFGYKTIMQVPRIEKITQPSNFLKENNDGETA